MPTGSTRCSTGRSSLPSPIARPSALTFSATKPVYLKTASSPRFIVIETTKTIFIARVRGTSRPMIGGSPPLSGTPDSLSNNRPAM